MSTSLLRSNASVREIQFHYHNAFQASMNHPVRCSSSDFHYEELYCETIVLGFFTITFLTQICLNFQRQRVQVR